jgi:hypothetical protein
MVLLFCIFSESLNCTASDSDSDYYPNLASLSINSGTLSPVFNPDITNYTAVISKIPSLIVTPTADNENDIITVNGITCDKGSSCRLDIPSSNFQVTIIVKTQYGFSKSYLINIVYEKPDTAGLSSLSVDHGALSPAFSADTLYYYENVEKNVSSITITPVAANTYFSVKVNQEDVMSGSGINLPLSSGTNTEIITVSDSYGNTRVYTILITREGAANDSVGLSDIAVSPGALNTAFAADTYSYSANVENDVNVFSVTPTALDSTAEITVNGTAVESGHTYRVPLTDGISTILIIVTGTGGQSKTYTVAVSHTSANDSAGLSSLILNAGSLDPSFASGTLNYSTRVDNDVSKLYISATAADTAAQIKYNGSASGSVSLNVGSSIVSIAVISESGSIKTYTINVFRKYDALITVSTQNADGAYCATVPDYVSSLDDSDAFTFKLGGDTVIIPASVLKSCKGFTVSRSVSTQSTLQKASSAAFNNYNIAGGVDVTLSGSGAVSSVLNARVTLEMGSGVKTALKNGEPEILYYNASAGTLENTNATIDLSAGTANFTAAKSGTYVFATALSGSSVKYTVTADSGYSNSGSHLSFNVKVTRETDSVKLEDAKLLVISTLSNGTQTFYIKELTGDSCNVSVSVDSRANSSAVYLISGSFDGGVVPKSYALAQFVKA